MTTPRRSSFSHANLLVSCFVLAIIVAGCSISVPERIASPTVPNTSPTPAYSGSPEPYSGPAEPDPGREVVDVEYLGHVTFATGTMFEDTEVGGLSGITYDSESELYYVLSDDRGAVNPARFYSVDIDLSDGRLEDGDVTFLAVTTLTDRDADSFPPGSVDPEAIELVGPDRLYISSEGDVGGIPAIDPFLRRFTPEGNETSALPVPDKFLPDGMGTAGVRDNKAFESLTSSPDRNYLYTATENALVQDGPASTLTGGSPSHLLEYDLENHKPGREFIYIVGPVPVPPQPQSAHADNGLVDLQAIDNNGTFLALERSYAEGVGNTVKIFQTSIDGATDVSGIFSLDAGNGSTAVYIPMTKTMVADIATLGLRPDNLEAMSFGPVLPDGRTLLILVSDNNFNPNQINQFIALAVELGPA